MNLSGYSLGIAPQPKIGVFWPPRGRMMIASIQQRVAEYYDIPLIEMTSKRRSRGVARPRQVAMYLSKQLTTHSLPEIGRRFGKRDHTTVIHAVRRIEHLMRTDPHMEEDVAILRSDFEVAA
jgi:chromosomal replication initiator protein